jgi:RHS repeat-associated protein
MSSISRARAAALAATLIAASGCRSSPEPSTARVTEAASASGTYVYAFDPSGLPTSVGTTGPSYSIARAPGVIQAGADTYRLDALGRVVAIDELSIAYGADGQIDHAASGEDTVSYLYDEDGHRILKSLNGAPSAAYTDEGYVTATEIDEPVHFAERLVGVLRNGEFALTATDLRGTVQADTDGASRTASPFGSRPVHPDLAAALDYTGRGFDADLGAIRMGARDYDARVGGFLEPDPLYLLHPENCVTSPVECSLYGYARDRPLDFTDPTGFDAYQVSGQMGGVVGADFRIDKNHDFSLRLDVFSGRDPQKVANTNLTAGWTSRGLLHDELSGWVREEAGMRIAGYNILWGQVELRAGTSTPLKLDANLASIPGRVGVSTDFTSLKPYGDLGGRREIYDQRNPKVTDSAFSPPKLRGGASISINSREIRTLPARTIDGLNHAFGSWDTQARNLLLGQGGFR